VANRYAANRKQDDAMQFTVATRSQFAMLDITDRVRSALGASGITSGLCHVFVPHTTAAVTINENADPDVPRDIIAALDRLVPLRNNYRHAEGNTAAHVKASLLGAAATIPVAGGKLLLGTWQSVFLCEFDGPRTRNVVVTVVSSPAEMPADKHVP
jgi:secondary thiamine-phosphate synthase enzyme